MEASERSVKSCKDGQTGLDNELKQSDGRTSQSRVSCVLKKLNMPAPYSAEAEVKELSIKGQSLISPDSGSDAEEMPTRSIKFNNHALKNRLKSAHPKLGMTLNHSSLQQSEASSSQVEAEQYYKMVQLQEYLSWTR